MWQIEKHFNKKLDTTIDIKALIYHMKKTFTEMRKLDLLNSLNLINMKDFIKILNILWLKLNLHLNTVNDEIILFNKFVKSSAHQISTWTLINFNTTIVYILN
jgi:hypothetical protein